MFKRLLMFEIRLRKENQKSRLQILKGGIFQMQTLSLPSMEQMNLCQHLLEVTTVTKSRPPTACTLPSP